MINLDHSFCATLLKMEEADALSMISKRGFESRVVMRDDDLAVVTRDYRLDRVNLSIVAGVVVQSTIG